MKGLKRIIYRSVFCRRLLIKPVYKRLCKVMYKHAKYKKRYSTCGRMSGRSGILSGQRTHLSYQHRFKPKGHSYLMAITVDTAWYIWFFLYWCKKRETPRWTKHKIKRDKVQSDLSMMCRNPWCINTFGWLIRIMERSIDYKYVCIHLGIDDITNPRLVNMLQCIQLFLRNTILKNFSRNNYNNCITNTFNIVPI